VSVKDGNSEVATNVWGTKGSEIVYGKTSDPIGCNEDITVKSATDVKEARKFGFSKDG
jgi:hypothetical protein